MKLGNGFFQKSRGKSKVFMIAVFENGRRSTGVNRLVCDAEKTPFRTRLAKLVLPEEYAWTMASGFMPIPPRPAIPTKIIKRTNLIQ